MLNERRSPPTPKLNSGRSADNVCNMSPIKKKGLSIVLSAKNSSLVFNNLVSQGAREAKLLKTSHDFVAEITIERLLVAGDG